VQQEITELMFGKDLPICDRGRAVPSDVGMSWGLIVVMEGGQER
jgi:hypothetical protein